MKMKKCSADAYQTPKRIIRTTVIAMFLCGLSMAAQAAGDWALFVRKMSSFDKDTEQR